MKNKTRNQCNTKTEGQAIDSELELASHSASKSKSDHGKRLPLGSIQPTPSSCFWVVVGALLLFMWIYVIDSFPPLLRISFFHNAPSNFVTFITLLSLLQKQKSEVSSPRKQSGSVRPCSQSIPCSTKPSTFLQSVPSPLLRAPSALYEVHPHRTPLSSLLHRCSRLLHAEATHALSAAASHALINCLCSGLHAWYNVCAIGSWIYMGIGHRT